MVALCSATLTPCSSFLLQQQEQWCWDARTWLGWMVKPGFPTAMGASLPYLCFSLGSCSLAKPSSFPCPGFCLCAVHTWLRGVSVTSVHLHPGFAALRLPGPSWALGKRGACGALSASCSEQGQGSPAWAGGGPGAVCPVTGPGRAQLPRAVGRGVAAQHPRAARQTGRKKEGSRSAVLQHGGLGEILG